MIQIMEGHPFIAVGMVWIMAVIFSRRFFFLRALRSFFRRRKNGVLRRDGYFQGIPLPIIHQSCRRKK